MGSVANPFTGSSWSSAPQSGPSQSPWLSNAPTVSGPGNPQGYGAWGNPGNYSNPKGSGETILNAGLNNIIAGQMKNQLAPQFAQLMQQYGGQAGDFFKQLMNLGSPYYQQKQQEGFTQGVQQNQNAGAMAQQQLRAQGYGNTPSGANAAMIGGMEQSGAQSLSEQYLQNLFQNESMQAQGASGLAQMAQMFNPTPLLGGTNLGSPVTAGPSFFQNFATTTDAVANLVGSVSGAGKQSGG